MAILSRICEQVAGRRSARLENQYSPEISNFQSKLFDSLDPIIDQSFLRSNQVAMLAATSRRLAKNLTLAKRRTGAPKTRKCSTQAPQLPQFPSLKVRPVCVSVCQCASLIAVWLASFEF